LAGVGAKEAKEVEGVKGAKELKESAASQCKSEGDVQKAARAEYSCMPR
jgi:hypothetical protein